jgi:predicted alpha/beta superfamily hydrolase
MEDYTPIRSKEPRASEPLGGDGPKFLSFLQHKVLPAIESKYRIDSTQRLLSGSSAGGLFSLYALLERPELFQSVLALSPATGWANKWLFAREKEFRKAHPALKNRVWLSVGTDEWTEFTQNARDFFKQFKASNYEGITLRVYEVPGERHAGNKPEAFNRALRFALRALGSDAETGLRRSPHAQEVDGEPRALERLGSGSPGKPVEPPRLRPGAAQPAAGSFR